MRPGARRGNCPPAALCLKTMKTLRDKLGRAVTAAIAWAGPAVALAQDNPDPPGLSKTPAPWVGYIVMFLLLAGVVGVSLMPSKRGHQD